MGKITFADPDDIFNTGQELMDAIAGKSLDRPIRWAVGIVGVLPKQLVHRLLKPDYKLERTVALFCYDGSSVE